MQIGRTSVIPITDITFRGQIFGNKTFPFIFSSKQVLFKTCTRIFHMVLTISRKDPLISICEYFCSKCHYGHYKTRVSRHSGCWLLLSVISNIIGPVFSSISFASLIHLCPEM